MRNYSYLEDAIGKKMLELLGKGGPLLIELEIRYGCEHVCTVLCVCVRACVCVHACTRVCTYMCVHVPVCMCVHVSKVYNMFISGCMCARVHIRNTCTVYVPAFLYPSECSVIFI